MSSTTAEAAHPIPSKDCLICGIAIETMCFKETGACCDEHFKAYYGTAKVSKIHRV